MYIPLLLLQPHTHSQRYVPDADNSEQMSRIRSLYCIYDHMVLLLYLLNNHSLHHVYDYMTVQLSVLHSHIRPHVPVFHLLPVHSHKALLLSLLHSRRFHHGHGHMTSVLLQADKSRSRHHDYGHRLLLMYNTPLHKYVYRMLLPLLLHNRSPMYVPDDVHTGHLQSVLLPVSLLENCS